MARSLSAPEASMSSKFAPHADRQAGELSGACLLRNKPEQGVPVNDVPALAAVFASETLFSLITLLRALAVGVWGLAGVRNMLSLSVSVVAGQLSAQTCAAINSALVSLARCSKVRIRPLSPHSTSAQYIAARMLAQQGIMLWASVRSRSACATTQHEQLSGAGRRPPTPGSRWSPAPKSPSRCWRRPWRSQLR